MTVTGSRGLPEDEVPVRLTPRQRQVIGLIERGYTNAQVAEELGVSLDGAKWHVREIMATLGVDTREDAAEYWRRRNGLPSRLQRLRRALLPQGSWLRVATIAAAAAVMAGGVIAAAFFLLGGDDEVEPAATTTAEPSLTVAATPTPTAATATPTPDPDIGPDGVPIQDFEIGPPVDILAGGVLYWSWAGIEGPRQNLYRGYRTASGETVIENLYDRLPEHSSVAANAYDLSSGRIAVLLCRIEYCGGYADASPASEAYLTVSGDFGVTWSEPVRMPIDWFPVAFLDGNLISVQYTRSGAGVESSFELLDEPFPVPDGGYPMQLTDGRVLLSLNEPGRPLIELDGTPAYTPPVITGAVQTVPEQAIPTLDWTRWHTGNPETLVGKREQGVFTRAFRSEGGGLYLYHEYRPEVVLGRWDEFAQVLTPVLIDLRQGKIHRIEGLGEPRGYFVAIDMRDGAFAAAIPGAGDCLNVRAAPSLQAAVLECVPDGVLLELTGAEESADGMDWRGVTLAPGGTGWASSQFLR